MTMSWCRERLFHQLQHIPAPCCGGGGSILGYVSHFPEHTIWKRCRMNVCLHISTGHSWITNTWPTDVGPCFKSDIVVHKRNSIWLCFWCFYVRLVKVFLFRLESCSFLTAFQESSRRKLQLAGKKPPRRQQQLRGVSHWFTVRNKCRFWLHTSLHSVSSPEKNRNHWVIKHSRILQSLCLCLWLVFSPKLSHTGETHEAEDEKNVWDGRANDGRKNTHREGDTDWPVRCIQGGREWEGWNHLGTSWEPQQDLEEETNTERRFIYLEQAAPVEVHLHLQLSINTRAHSELWNTVKDPLRVTDVEHMAPIWPLVWPCTVCQWPLLFTPRIMEQEISEKITCIGWP